MLTNRFSRWKSWAGVLAMAAPWLCGCSSAPEPARKQAAAVPAGTARILHFYAAPGAIGRGETAIVCYGVESARIVRIEPAVADLSPSPNRCFNVSPERDTRYTLFAQGADGEPVSQALTVQVQARRSSPPPPTPAKPGLITAFAATSTQISPGQPVTICYGVRDAESVRLEPEGRSLPVAERQCISLRPSSTTTYKLVVSGTGGRTEREELVIRVK